MTEHHAPAVRYPVGRSRFHGVLVVLLSFLGALALALWVVLSDAFTVRHVAGWVVWVGTTLWAALTWWRSSLGELVYDGHGWLWTQQGQSVAVSVRVELDIQNTLLMQMSQATGRHPRWLWLERSGQPTLWRALRRAAFAQHRAAPTVSEKARPA